MINFNINTSKMRKKDNMVKMELKINNINL